MMFTLRFMREISARMRRTPARQVAHDYGISPSSAQRIDHWVLAHDMPEARMGKKGGSKKCNGYKLNVKVDATSKR